MTSTNLYCSLQNRLGAMDRVLLAFTHRGIVPTQMFLTQNEDTNALDLAITFDGGDDEKALQKLVKSLQTQVYVLDVRIATFEEEQAPAKANAYASHPAAKAAKMPEAVPA